MSLRFKRVTPSSERAASDRDRSFNKATAGDARSPDDQSPLSLSNGTSNAVNLIAAAVAANVAFNFATPVEADENAEGKTENRDSDTGSEHTEGDHAANEVAEHLAEQHNDYGASGRDAHTENPSGNDSPSENADSSALAQSAQPQQHAENHNANAKHHNSSTAPGLMGKHQSDGAAASKASASGGSEQSSSGDTAGRTFVFTGVASNGDIASFVGTAETASTTTVDFSQVNPTTAANNTTHKVVAHVAADGTVHTDAPADTSLNTDANAKNGVLVELDAHKETAHTAHGEATVQAWSLDADGKADTALAHIANVDNVIGTVGNDIVSGNAHANTVTYTASDDAQHATAGGDGTGAASSYGFDIVSGGPSPFGHGHERAGDVHDTVDFSHVGSAAGVAAAAAVGVAAEILSNHATGIKVDLQVAVTIEATNPHSGATVEVTGSVVSANGGEGTPLDLALLTWAPQSAACDHGTAPAATIENIVGSQGADNVAGNAKDNTYFAVGDGTSGASLFDGRSGSDTIDFSKLLGGITGIDLHLGDATSGGGSETSVATVVSGADAGTAIVALSNVENVVGSHGNDTIQGNSADNILTGIGGSDTFIFKSTILVDGLEYANIGNDVITDFHGYGGGGSSGSGGGHDSLWLNSNFFHFDNGWSSSDKLQKLFDAFAQDDNGSMVIRIDDHNSIRLDHVSLNEARFYFSDTFYFI